jgi:hypothetical protein
MTSTDQKPLAHLNATREPDERLPLLRRIRYRLTETKLRAPFIRLRHRGFRPADVFLVSYPKSGSTWLRFLLYQILTGQPSEFGVVNPGLAVVGDHFHAPGLLPQGGRLIGTHEQYRPVYHKVVYLARDVRDVILSHFRRERLMGVVPDSLDKYVLSIMTGHKRHGSWHQHVLSYLDSDLANSSQFLLVRFDELRHDTQATLGRVLDFLEVRTDAGTIRRAIEDNSLEAMRAKEDRVHTLGVRVRRQPHRSLKNEGKFVYQGAVGGWRGKLTPAQLEMIDRFAGDALVRLGYELSQPA